MAQVFFGVGAYISPNYRQFSESASMAYGFQRLTIYVYKPQVWILSSCLWSWERSCSNLHGGGEGWVIWVIWAKIQRRREKRKQRKKRNNEVVLGEQGQTPFFFLFTLCLPSWETPPLLLDNKSSLCTHKSSHGVHRRYDIQYTNDLP